ncbi:hypothetical protein [Paulownia witches'-broom phytoplasma]|uniref:hypothetical protein n=1 Tax=Paulownia witches'-broom phytoplasma TaxID=39647 RepID=UPI001CECB324|nr:hypothetical protein [Paulownia witches'-broom phytoplasma]
MDIQQTIINIVESKIFISFTSFIFGIFIYWLYFYIKEWKKVNMILVMNYEM